MSEGGDGRVERLALSAYRVPTDEPESDGTLEWDSTTVVVVHASGAGQTGLGYSYTDVSAAELIRGHLARAVEGTDVMNVPGAWQAMHHAVRNLGHTGLTYMAISAVDLALWDLKARVLERSLDEVIGAVRDGVPVYGSGGFTSYSDERLSEQLGDWVAEGIPRVKMKVGREPQRDVERVRAARAAIGSDAELFVDANGAYTRKEALAFAQAFREQGVVWFEEPVSSDDLTGLRLIRDRAPAGMDVAAGEYGDHLFYFRRMLGARAVDVQQADITRCGGITGFLRVAALTQAHSLPLSGHTAPMMHVHAACAVPNLMNLEYFHDHVRVEHLLFEGVLEPRGGKLHPDRSRPGNGLELKRADVERYAI